MLTRCVDQVHVFLDTQTQCTGPYRDSHPVRALAERWATDTSKLPASSYPEPVGDHDSDQPPTPTRLHNLDSDPDAGAGQGRLFHAQVIPPFPSARQLPSDPFAHELGIGFTD